MDDIALPIFVTLVTFICLIDCDVTIRKLSPDVIRTTNGRLRGVVVDLPGRRLLPVTRYLGIQYASVRGGKLRFMPPTGPPEGPSSITVAMKPAPACPQPMFDSSDAFSKMPKVRAMFLSHLSMYTQTQAEECLTLDIYVPTREWNETKRFPVMVYIHGTSYATGSGNAYDGSVLASFGRVIVVTVNFRLGVLGYLTVGKDKVPGNYALLDIIAALHWMGENIAAFGGDSQSVTLFGSGHGAALVNVLMVSPVNRGNRLFRRAILQSGSAFSSFAIVQDAASCTRQLARSTNCSAHIDNAKFFIACLRENPVENLVQKLPVSRKYFSCFGPTPSARSMVLPRGIPDLYKQASRLNIKTDVMFGFVKNEAYDYFTQADIDNGLSIKRKIQMFRTFVHNMFRYNRQRIYQYLGHAYTEWSKDISHSTRRQMIMNLLGDGLFVMPALKAASYNLDGRDTYMYMFNYTPRSDSKDRPLGSVHGDELAFVFGSPIINGSEPFPGMYSKADRYMSETMITYWTNFAKSGNPNNPGKFYPAVTTRHRVPVFPTMRNNYYLHIGSKVRAAQNYRSRKRMLLWHELITKTHKADKLDPRTHLLLKSYNISSFDEPHRLRIVPGIFPPPLPEPTTPSPLATAVGSENHKEGLTHGYDISPEASTAELSSNRSFNPKPSIHSANIQVSITIGVGCSLLLLNIFVFAAIYYQREKIRRLKHPVVRSDHVTSSANKNEALNHEHELIGLLDNGGEQHLTTSTQKQTPPSILRTSVSSSVVTYSPEVTSPYKASPYSVPPYSTSPIMSRVPLSSAAPSSNSNSHLQYDGDKFRVENSTHKDDGSPYRPNRLCNSVTMV